MNHQNNDKKTDYFRLKEDQEESNQPTQINNSNDQIGNQPTNIQIIFSDQTNHQDASIQTDKAQTTPQSLQTNHQAIQIDPPEQTNAERQNNLELLQNLFAYNFHQQSTTLFHNQELPIIDSAYLNSPEIQLIYKALCTCVWKISVEIITILLTLCVSLAALYEQFNFNKMDQKVIFFYFLKLSACLYFNAIEFRLFIEKVVQFNSLKCLLKEEQRSQMQPGYQSEAADQGRKLLEMQIAIFTYEITSNNSRFGSQNQLFSIQNVRDQIQKQRYSLVIWLRCLALSKMILTVLNLSIIFNSIGSNSSTKCKYALLLNLLLDNYILIFIILLFTILLSILIPLYIYKTLKRKFDSHYYSYKVNLQIKNLPISSYSSIKEKLTNNECSICLSCYEENDEVCVLKCDHHHHFHKPCIFQWIKKKNECPLCRKIVLNL